MKANTTDSSTRVRRLCALAVFFALSYASVFVFRIHVLFLTFDIKDAIITIAAMMYGPFAGLAISAMDALLELTISETGLWGMIMNFISSAVFSFTAGLIYRCRRTLSAVGVGRFDVAECPAFCLDARCGHLVCLVAAYPHL